MVAFNEPPTLTCVTTTAVNTAHSGKRNPANCATAKGERGSKGDANCELKLRAVGG